MPDASSALPKAEAARLRGDDDEPLEADAELDKDLQALAAEVRKHAPVLSYASGLEERLWAALERSVSLLEVKLAALEASDVPAYVGDATGEAEAVRNIAETLDRLGLKPPPPPVEASGPDVSEVWIGRIEEEEAA